MKNVPAPLNTNEEYLYAMVVRLDALCQMLSSLIEHIAEKEKVATTKNTVAEKKVTPRKATTKTTTAKTTAKKKVEK